MEMIQTLLDLDKDVLHAITALALVQDKSAGEIVSAMIRKSSLSPRCECSRLDERIQIEIEETRSEIKMRELAAKIRFECSGEIEALNQQKRELEVELQRANGHVEGLTKRLIGSQDKSKRLKRNLQNLQDKKDASDSDLPHIGN